MLDGDGRERLFRSFFPVLVCREPVVRPQLLQDVAVRYLRHSAELLSQQSKRS